jgi:DNA polymerase I-like protein with 3'-5' exonuclease and polymerase domains
MRIAVVDKCPANTKYEDYFNFEFDKLHLSSIQKQKILKKDIDLEINEDDYDFIITIGSEATKFLAKRNSVLNFQGSLVDDKYLPIANPAMFRFKPEGKPAFEHALESIHKYIAGELETDLIECIPISTKDEAIMLLEFLLKENPKYITVDTETSALYPRDGYVLGICLAWEEDQGYYIDADIIDEEVSELMNKAFTTRYCVFHNAKFDMHMLRYHFNFVFPYWEDTMAMHYCLNEQPGTHGLKELTLKYSKLGDYDKELDIWKRTYCKQHGVKLSDFTYDLIPFDIMYPYAATDAVATLKLFRMFQPILAKDEKLTWVYENLLKAGTECLLDVEDNGVPFDKTALLTAQAEIGAHIHELEEKLYSYPELKTFESVKGTKLNPNSPMQLRELLFGMLGLPSSKLTATGATSTDAEVLEGLAELHEIPKLLLAIRKEKKIKNTYIDKILPGLDRDGRLRTNFNLLFTTSGRLSSSGKLNMQQLPRDNKVVKKCIAANEGYKIVSQDLKTAEMWLAAALSGDEVLADFFRTGGDYHGFMAVQKFGLPCDADDVAKLYPDRRQDAKAVSFEILYKLNFGEPVLKKFKKLKDWLIKQKRLIEQNGEIYQAFGRKRRLPNVFSNAQHISAHEVRSGVNALIQGPASDINLLACIDMQKWIRAEGYSDEMRIFGMVHDSILAEVKETHIELYSTKLKEFTQKDRGISIPDCPIGLDLEIGDNYAFA